MPAMLEKDLVNVIKPVVEAVVLVEKDLDVLKQRIENLPEPKDGADGKDGRDAEPVDVDGIVETVKNVVIPSVLEEVSTQLEDAIKQIPTPANGKDGESGKDGVDGQDGIGIKSIELGVDRKSMTLVLDNDETIDVELPEGERGERGEKGLDGADGLGINTKQWEAGVYREGSYVTHALGKVYKALRDTAAKPNSEDWERVGTAGFEWTGLKQDGYVYQDGDLYIDGGSSFLWWNGKGHMFTQRGARGAQGEKGLDGRHGADAPTIVAVKYTRSGVHMALSDGSVMDADVDGFDDVVKEISQGAVLYYMDQVYADIKAEGGTPIRSFKGTFEINVPYSTGDVVTYNKSVWVARESTSASFFDDQVWRRMFSMGAGGGGGGGGGTGWNYIATQQINMSRQQIINMAPPRVGNVGQLDAVNRTFMEAAIAAGSLFQGTVTELTQTTLPQLPNPTTKGHYWTWVGSANHVVGPADTILNADLNGQLLQVGDWIQSNGVSWSHVPGDLLTKQRWQTLGGFTDWVSGQSYEAGSLVHYQGHLYRSVASLSGAPGEAAPNVAADPLRIVIATITTGKKFTITVSGQTSSNSVLNLDLDVNKTPGLDTQTTTVIAGQSAINVAASIVQDWSNTDTTAVLRPNTSIIDVNVKNIVDSITSFTVNQTTVDAANVLGGNIQHWVDISPSLGVKDLNDTLITAPVKMDEVLVYDGTFWINKKPKNLFVQMTKAAYTALGTNVDPDVLYLIKG